MIPTTFEKQYREAQREGDSWKQKELLEKAHSSLDERLKDRTKDFYHRFLTQIHLRQRKTNFWPSLHSKLSQTILASTISDRNSVFLRNRKGLIGHNFLLSLAHSEGLVSVDTKTLSILPGPALPWPSFSVPKRWKVFDSSGNHVRDENPIHDACYTHIEAFTARPHHIYRYCGECTMCRLKKECEEDMEWIVQEWIPIL